MTSGKYVNEKKTFEIIHDEKIVNDLSNILKPDNTTAPVKFYNDTNVQMKSLINYSP